MTTLTLLDGSIGQELVTRSGDRATPLWSTQVMIDRPHLLRDVHASYFAAGATVATANTYATLRDRLARVGRADQIGMLARDAVTAARTARDTHGSGRVAGSIGPLVQSYRPDLCPPAAEAAAIYAEPVAAIAPGVDLLLLETMSSVDQARGAMMAARETDLPVWLAVSVMDEDGTRLRSGEPLAALAPLMAELPPDALLINCAPPEAIDQGLDTLKGFGLPFGAYANGFTRIGEGFLGPAPTVDALQSRHDLTPAAHAAAAMAWIDRGATIVGGCCEVGPAHIAELARRIREAGHAIV